jgi:integrase
MPLNDTQVRNAKSKEKPYKLADEKGLILIVNPNGSKWWRFRYRVGGREKMLSLGVYPAVSLKKARQRRDDQRELVAESVDPSRVRQADKELLANTFEGLSREWFAKQSKYWAVSHSSKIIARLEKDVFPWIGADPISKVTAADLLKCLRRVEIRGKIETAHRIHQNCSAIFRYAVATGRADRDPCGDLRGAIPPAKVRHHPTITEPSKIGELLRAIDGYDGSIIVRCALRLSPLVFLRQGELRQAEWKEINFNEREWRVPAERMKMDELHIVPLSVQAMSIFNELKPITGSGRYIFPSARSA